MWLLKNVQSNTPHPMNRGIPPEVWIEPSKGKRMLVGDPSRISRAWSHAPNQFNDFTNDTIAEQPLYALSGINGLPTMESINIITKLRSLNSVTPAPVNFYLQTVWRILPTTALGFHVLNIGFGGGFQYMLSANFSLNSMFSRPYLSGSKGILTHIGLATNFTYIITVVYDQIAGIHMFRVNGVTIGSSSDLATSNYSTWNMTMLNAGPTGTGGAEVQMSNFMLGRDIPSLEHLIWREKYLGMRYGVTI